MGEPIDPMITDRENLLLAGDIGGTKTMLAILSPETGLTANLAEATFENRHYGGLEEIIAEFLDRFGIRVRRASFSVAGPVIEGQSVLSNLRWHLDHERLRKPWDLASVHLVNDLQATAYALAHLSSENIHTLQPGSPSAHGPRAVIAPGTGLGEGFLLWDGFQFEAHPSEGGNADFAPADGLQLELLRYLHGTLGHVSYEQVCSGLGIPSIYRFLKETGVAEEPEWLAVQLAGAADPTPIIIDAALRQAVPCFICTQTLRVFASILAAEAGNLALRVLATGGVYLGGGIPPRILPVLQGEEFVAAFRRKGRFSELMTRFPLHVILEPRAALFGAAHYGFRTPVAHPTR